MKINVKQLETGNRGEEQSLCFDFGLDLSGVRRWGEAPYREPVRVTGKVRGYLGVLTCELTADYTRHDFCSRCLRPVQTRKSMPFSHVIMERDRKNETLDEPDDCYILLDDGILDLGELAATDLLLEEDYVVLCDPECKGLCPVCGVNRNDAMCSCSVNADSGQEKEPDARFAALLQFIEDETKE